MTATRSPEHEGRMRKAIGRMMRSADEREADRLQDAVVQQGATAVGDCRCHDEVCVAGRLRTVSSSPRTAEPELEADLYDGSGAVTLLWLGRREIAGIEPGRRIKVRGRLAERKGRKVIFNPSYELLPADR